MKIPSPKSNGFTLVETLVAIAILMIAVAGPLTIANQALTAALGARNAMTATYLAQDGMEVIKHVKDNNVALSITDWKNGVYDIQCTGQNGNYCAIPDMVQSSAVYNVIIKPCDSNCPLYANSSDPQLYRYTTSPSASDKPTPFKRYYFLSNVTATEMIVTVVVSWNDGSIPNEIRLQELMTNAAR